MEESKPTLDDCIVAVTKINEGVEQPASLLLHKARWLYMINRLNFFEDMPVLIDIIKYEQLLMKSKEIDVEADSLPTIKEVEDEAQERYPVTDDTGGFNFGAKRVFIDGINWALNYVTKGGRGK